MDVLYAFFILTALCARAAHAQGPLPGTLPVGITGGDTNACVGGETLSSSASCNVKAAPGYAVDGGTTTYSCSAEGVLSAPTAAATGCLQNFFESVANTTCTACPSDWFALSRKIECKLCPNGWATNGRVWKVELL